VFVFYDTETTGLNRDFDQVLQFAAILTDDALNEVGRFNLRCRCRPWIVPAPIALKVTGVRPALLGDPSLPSLYEMMAAVRARLEQWSPALFVGYNTMRFDEPRLQRAFWETLNPPYLTVTHGNARLDILPLVKAASRLAPGILDYPVSARGQTGFRLDALAPLNGFAHERAHDALADVEATLHIARILAERAPALWQSAVRSAPKAETVALLRSQAPVLVVEHFANEPALWWGRRIDGAGATGSSALVARLGADWAGLSKADDAGLEAFLSGSPRPLRQIGLNKAPLLFGAAAAQAGWGLAPSEHELAQNAWLAGEDSFRERLVRLNTALQPEWPQAEHLEQMIHAGFPGKADEARMARFHKSDWPARAGLIREFEDGRLRQLAQRLVFEAAPHLLAPADSDRLAQAIARRLHPGHNDDALWRSIPAARREIMELREDASASGLADEIEAWLAALEARFPLARPV
jgi:exodeoxyribonuclease I